MDDIYCRAVGGRIPLMGEVSCLLQAGHPGKHQGRMVTRRRTCVIFWNDGEDIETAEHQWIPGGLEEQFRWAS